MNFTWAVRIISYFILKFWLCPSWKLLSEGEFFVFVFTAGTCSDNAFSWLVCFEIFQEFIEMWCGHACVSIYAQVVTRAVLRCAHQWLLGGCTTAKRHHYKSVCQRLKSRRRLRWLQSVVSAKSSSECLESERWLWWSYSRILADSNSEHVKSGCRLRGTQLILSADNQPWGQLYEPIQVKAFIFEVHSHFKYFDIFLSQGRCTNDIFIMSLPSTSPYSRELRYISTVCGIPTAVMQHLPLSSAFFSCGPLHSAY